MPMEHRAPDPPEATCVLCNDEVGTTFLCGEGWVGEQCMAESVKPGPVEPPEAIGRARSS